MKKANGHEVIQLFEAWSPKKLASYPNDPIGLAIGTLNKTITKVLVTLDVTLPVVEEAIEQGCELIIAHHPPIFAKLSHVRTDSAKGRLIEKCIKHDIAVYAAHTNLDVAKGGVNDLLAEALKLQNCKPLEQTYSENMMKLAVFVPSTHADSIRQAMAKAGAGAIGDYEACSYTLQGEGRFMPQQGATPFVGEIGHLHVEQEEKIEVVFPQSLKNRVLKAMLQMHPYEEPAYDLFVMDLSTNEEGIGRIGTIETQTLEQFAQFVKQALDVPAVRVVGPLNAQVKKVAVLGGSGSSYIQKAKYAGADVFVTGDLEFHSSQDAEIDGLSLIDPGHHVEKVMIPGVAAKMRTLCEQNKLAVEFMESTVNTEPFKFI